MSQCLFPLGKSSGNAGQMEDKIETGFQQCVQKAGIAEIADQGLNPVRDRLSKGSVGDNDPLCLVKSERETSHKPAPQKAISTGDKNTHQAFTTA
ncbi:hypothetical protein RvVAR0630_37510 [Agrobacterium vitis]|nr:hypothetical protein RvVAR0630_37510 [Agrobacterium vitis]